jgi:hypothetical protein
MTSSGEIFCSFTISESRSCSAFSCSRLDANGRTNQLYTSTRQNNPLTLLYDVRLEICNVADKRFLSPFPATDAFLELFAVTFKELVVGE